MGRYTHVTQVTLGSTTLTIGQSIQCVVDEKRRVAKIDQITLVEQDKPWALVTDSQNQSEWISLNNWKEQMDKGLFMAFAAPTPVAPPAQPQSFITTKQASEDDICI